MHPVLMYVASSCLKVPELRRASRASSLQLDAPENRHPKKDDPKSYVILPAPNLGASLLARVREPIVPIPVDNWDLLQRRIKGAFSKDPDKGLGRNSAASRRPLSFSFCRIRPPRNPSLSRGLYAPPQRGSKTTELTRYWPPVTRKGSLPWSLCATGGSGIPNKVAQRSEKGSVK